VSGNPPEHNQEEIMQKKIAGLLGAMATLGAFGAVQAAPTPAPTDVLKANSFADLLEPIPNAATLLLAVDESGPGASAKGNVQLAQMHHHHHHHHHGMRRVIRRMMGHHHHHHHHHHFRHHHHHHHHHN
jgi:hypothetical protein